MSGQTKIFVCYEVVANLRHENLHLKFFRLPKTRLRWFYFPESAADDGAEMLRLGRRLIPCKLSCQGAFGHSLNFYRYVIRLGFWADGRAQRFKSCSAFGIATCWMLMWPKSSAPCGSIAARL
jgi:hypothetical protein